MQSRVRLLFEQLALNGDDVLITCGARTPAEQHAEYLKGRPFLPGGSAGSPVTYVDGDGSFHCWGVAIDVAPIGKVFGFARLDYADARYESIVRLAKPLGFDWGFTMWGFDKPHLQYTQGLTIADFRAGKRLQPVADSPSKADLLTMLSDARRELPNRTGVQWLQLRRYIERLDLAISRRP